MTTAFTILLGLGVLALDIAALGSGPDSSPPPGTAATPGTTSPSPTAPPTTSLPGMALFGVAAASQGTAPAKDKGPAPDANADLPASTASYTLYGVILSGGDANRQAILGENDTDQRRYREGDKAPDGALVKMIRRTDVVLERDGRLEALALNKDALLGAEGAQALPGAPLPGEEDGQQALSPPPPPPPRPNLAPAHGGTDPLANIRRAIAARKAAAARGEGQPPMFELPPPQQ